MPDDCFPNCDTGRPDLRGFVFTLLLFVQVVEELQGDRRERQPLVGIVVGAIPTDNRGTSDHAAAR